MKRFINDVKKYYRYVLYAGKSELKAEVANSYLNWLWWVIEPICFMLIYSLVFGVFFGRNMPHIRIFIYTGIVFWDFFNHMVTGCVKLVRKNKPIVSKVYLPKYMLIFIKMYVNLFKMMIAFIILVGMCLLEGIPFTLQTLWIIPLLITLIIFTFGVCCVLMHFGVYVDDLGNVVRIFLRMVFYLTGVFYDVEERVTKTLGHQAAVIIQHFNPMASLISGARHAVLEARSPDLRFLTMWFVIGCILSVIGVRTIYKNENSYVKVI